MGAIEMHRPALPVGAQERKDTPICTGVLDYFPLALAEVARISKAGNDQHNPGKPLHWSRGKSTDHADCAVRHLLDRGTIDVDGTRHTAKAAWRILALLQTELEIAAGIDPFVTRAAPDHLIHAARAAHDAANALLLGDYTNVVTDSSGRRPSDHADLRARGMAAAIGIAEAHVASSGVPGDGQEVDFNGISFGGTDE